MANIVKTRAYPKELIDKFITNQKNLICTNSKQPDQNRLSGGFYEPAQFLSEFDNVRSGREYSFFEINKLKYDFDDSTFSLNTDISFPTECVEITLYADLLDTETECVFLSFAHKTTNFKKSLNYDIEQHFAVNAVSADKFAVIVYADWKINRDYKKSAAIFSYVFKNIEINCNHTYPKKEKNYIRFSNNTNSAFQTPPNIPALLKNHEENKNINIALFRTPDDTSDLDYLCEFEKDPFGHPYMCVPTAFDLTLHSGTTEFCKPVKAFCTISSLDPQFGGKYIVATGNSENIEESEVSIDVDSANIHIEMLKPWKVPFPYGGSWQPYDFSYEVVVELRTKTAEQQELSHTIYAISSIKKSGVSLITIPHISLRWGCLHEDTFIALADMSTKQIKDIRIGDYIACKEGNKQVGNIWRGSEDKYVCITTDFKNGLPPLLTTLDHPILTVNGFKRAKDIVINDVLICKMDQVKVTDITIEEKNINVYNLSFTELNSTQTMLANGIYVGDFDCQNKNI